MKNYLNYLVQKKIHLLQSGVCAILVLIGNTAMAQTDSSGKAGIKILPPAKQVLNESFKKNQINGYYRFFGYNRLWKEKLAIADDPTSDHFIQLGGDGYREPTLFLNIGGEVSENVFIGTNFYIAPTYKGGNNAAVDGDSISLNLGATLYGNFKIKNGGNVLLQTGGIIWHSVSKLTFWNNATPYNRFSIFDRNPWEPILKGSGKYRTFLNEGRILQDVRWNKQAFQGAVAEAYNLPGKINGSLFVGKSINNGGAGSFQGLYKPSLMYGGRLQKNIQSNSVGVNAYQSFEYLDSLKEQYKQNTVLSGETKLTVSGISLDLEAGFGKFTSPSYKGEYDHALLSKILIPEEISWLPIELSYYHIGKNFVNINSGVVNSSVPQAYDNKPANGLGTLYPYYSQVTEIGAYTNNRQSFALNTEFKRKNFRLNLGNMIASELSATSPNISFYHRINGLALSRIWNFSWMPSNYGPYNNLNSVFRGIYEVVNLTDTLEDGSSSGIKHFNTLELQAKYRLPIGKTHAYFHYLGSFNSVQKKSSLIPVSSDAAYMRIYYHEWEVFYQAHPRVTLVGYYGLEFAKGNASTTAGDVVQSDGSRQYRNQKGRGIGTGFDVGLGENVALYFRHRWFQHVDPSFKLDTYKGEESTLELKMFF